MRKPGISRGSSYELLLDLAGGFEFDAEFIALAGFGEGAANEGDGDEESGEEKACVEEIKMRDAEEAFPKVTPQCGPNGNEGHSEGDAAVGAGEQEAKIDQKSAEIEDSERDEDHAQRPR